jgi:hypothetical protein
MMKHWLFVGLICLCAVSHGAAQTAGNGWYAGAGFSLTPRVTEQTDDFAPAQRFTYSSAVFPSVFAGYRFEDVALEAGYRKLGVLNFSSNDDATRGVTHSNALTFSAWLPFPRAGKNVTFYGKGGLNLIRTITEMERRTAGFAIEGERNVWQVKPSLGLGAAFTAQEKWTVRAEAETIVGKLGHVTQSGRYQQALVGLSIARSF